MRTRIGTLAISLGLTLTNVGESAGIARTSRRAAAARDQAIKDPCRLLAAIFGGQVNQVETADEWAVTLKSGCCDDRRLQQQPILMGFERGGPAKLIDWGKSCGGGLGGPIRKPNTAVAVYHIGLTVKTSDTLRFSVIEERFVFDGGGKEKDSILSSCIEFNGEARFLARRR